jgi:hypothetical protein
MQTFLPYDDFDKSLKCLDYRRLGKQRVEAFQIINVLEGKAKKNKNGKVAWENHPAVLMWKGYKKALELYYNTTILEWERRGYKNNMQLIVTENIVLPPWFGNELFHASHRSNLLRKDPVYYSQFGWKESPDLEYVWPTKTNKGER